MERAGRYGTSCSPFRDYFVSNALRFCPRAVSLLSSSQAQVHEAFDDCIFLRDVMPPRRRDERRRRRRHSSSARPGPVERRIPRGIIAAKKKKRERILSNACVNLKLSRHHDAMTP